MALPLKPAKRKAFRTDGWGFVTAVADLAAPSNTELQAASGLTLSFYLLGDQETPATANTERVTLPRALGEGATYEALGLTTYTGGTLRAIWNPQAAAGSDDKKAWETLVDAATGVLWNRQNVAVDTDTAVGQFVDLYPVEIGPRFPTKTGTGTDAIWVFDAPVGVIAEPQFNVAIVA